MSASFRQLPKVDVLLREPALAAHPHEVAVEAARFALDRARGELRAERPMPDVARLAGERADLLARGRMRPVINATGVVIHTNLGRAPWPAEAVNAAADVARGYCNLELELATGRRGGRMDGITAQLAALVGAEAAIVVNNNAAAVLLALTAVAAGREVVVSRGELVEIGGSFRVPDVIASCGARLREVGTTNRTRIADYVAATGPETGAWLIVHPSNFRVIGFTESADRAELAAAAKERGVLLLDDLGSGSIRGTMGEPGVRSVLGAGVDLVMFSGDKLLGGPQAGIVAGRADLVKRLRALPLYRALRVDKVILAALEATLGLHLAGRPTPVDRMLAEGVDVLGARAARIAAGLPGATLQPDVGYVGGGSLPTEELATVVVAVPGPDPDRVAERLRTGHPAVMARVGRGALLLDPRTVPDADVDRLVAAVRTALAD